MSELRQLAYDLPPEDNDEVKYRQALEKQRAEIEDAINYYT
jgi:signal transduction histidine kinase